MQVAAREPGTPVRDALSRRPPRVRTVTAPPAVERATAAVAVAALGFRLDVRVGVTLGLAVAVLLLPVWGSVFRRYRGGLVAAGLVVLAAVNGLVLTAVMRSSHTLDSRSVLTDLFLVLEIGAGIGVLLWAREHFDDGAVAAFLGVGMCAWGVVHPVTGLGEVNPWKFTFAIPVSVLLIGLASRSRHQIVPIATTGLLALVSVVFDSRAYSAALALCAVLMVWRAFPRFGRTRRGWLGVIGLVAVVAGILYLLLTQLLVSGLLGTAAAERSQAQIETSGSLILGGRPEIAATWALLNDHVAGYGLGIVPTYADVAVAKAGMLTINYDPNNGYVTNFMFGNGFELHSVFGDLWARCGFGGLLLAGGAAAAALYAVGRGVATRTGCAVLFYAAVWTLWNIGFSPLVVSVPVLVLLGGLVLDPRRAGGAEVDAPAPPGTEVGRVGV